MVEAELKQLGLNFPREVQQFRISRFFQIRSVLLRHADDDAPRDQRLIIRRILAAQDLWTMHVTTIIPTQEEMMSGASSAEGPSQVTPRAAAVELRLVDHQTWRNE